MYFNFRNKYRKLRSSRDLSLLKIASKSYKKDIDKAFTDYHKKMITKIRNLKSSDPKSYWQIISNDTKSHAKINNISLEVFAEYFAALNKQDNEENDSEIVGILDEYNNEINLPFNEEEISSAISRLKLNKAGGSDFILNEYLKFSPENMILLYTKLFNLILTTGKTPQSWSIGVIKPLFKSKGNVSDPDNYRGITLLSCFGKLFTNVINCRLTDF